MANSLIRVHSIRTGTRRSATARRTRAAGTSYSWSRPALIRWTRSDHSAGRRPNGLRLADQVVHRVEHGGQRDHRPRVCPVSRDKAVLAAGLPRQSVHEAPRIAAVAHAVVVAPDAEGLR
jgi:hypothetical protein